MKKPNSIKKTARITAILLLIMAVAAAFSMGYVPSRLFVTGDATATANNIITFKSLFNLSIIGHLIILFTDIAVAILLFVILKPVSKTLALIAAVFRLIMVSMRGINLVNFFIALTLLNGVKHVTVFETDQLHGLVILFLNAFNNGVLIDMIFFSVHIFIIGYLVFKSGYIPGIFGVLLILGSFGYLINSITSLFFPEYQEIISRIVFVPELVSELALVVWFLIKGVNVEKWEKRALESVKTYN